MNGAKEGETSGAHEVLVVAAVMVPVGWQRKVESHAVTYTSPGGSVLCSMEEVKSYLLADGTCKCGLECPLVLHKVFNFERGAAVRPRSAEDVKADADMTKLCNHKRKIIAMATLHKSMETGGHHHRHHHHRTTTATAMVLSSAGEGGVRPAPRGGGSTGPGGRSGRPKPGAELLFPSCLSARANSFLSRLRAGHGANAARPCEAAPEPPVPAGARPRLGSSEWSLGGTPEPRDACAGGAGPGSSGGRQRAGSGERGQRSPYYGSQGSLSSAASSSSSCFFGEGATSPCAESVGSPDAYGSRPVGGTEKDPLGILDPIPARPANLGGGAATSGGASGQFVNPTAFALPSPLNATPVVVPTAAAREEEAVAPDRGGGHGNHLLARAAAAAAVAAASSMTMPTSTSQHLHHHQQQHHVGSPDGYHGAGPAGCRADASPQRPRSGSGCVEGAGGAGGARGPAARSPRLSGDAGYKELAPSILIGLPGAAAAAAAASHSYASNHHQQHQQHQQQQGKQQPGLLGTPLCQVLSQQNPTSYPASSLLSAAAKAQLANQGKQPGGTDLPSKRGVFQGAGSVLLPGGDGAGSPVGAAPSLRDRLSGGHHRRHRAPPSSGPTAADVLSMLRQQVPQQQQSAQQLVHQQHQQPAPSDGRAGSPKGPPQVLWRGGLLGSHPMSQLLQSMSSQQAGAGGARAAGNQLAPAAAPEVASPDDAGTAAAAKGHAWDLDGAVAAGMSVDECGAGNGVVDGAGGAVATARLKGGASSPGRAQERSVGASGENARTRGHERKDPEEEVGLDLSLPESGAGEREATPVDRLPTPSPAPDGTGESAASLAAPSPVLPAGGTGSAGSEGVAQAEAPDCAEARRDTTVAGAEEQPGADGTTQASTEQPLEESGEDGAAAAIAEDPSAASPKPPSGSSQDALAPALSLPGSFPLLAQEQLALLSQSTLPALGGPAGLLAALQLPPLPFPGLLPPGGAGAGLAESLGLLSAPAAFSLPPLPAGADAESQAVQQLLLQLALTAQQHQQQQQQLAALVAAQGLGAMLLNLPFPDAGAPSPLGEHPASLASAIADTTFLANLTAAASMEAAAAAGNSLLLSLPALMTLGPQLAAGLLNPLCGAGEALPREEAEAPPARPADDVPALAPSPRLELAETSASEEDAAAGAAPAGPAPAPHDGQRRQSVVSTPAQQQNERGAGKFAAPHLAAAVCSLPATGGAGEGPAEAPPGAVPSAVGVGEGLLPPPTPSGRAAAVALGGGAGAEKLPASLVPHLLSPLLTSSLLAELPALASAALSQDLTAPLLPGSMLLPTCLLNLVGVGRAAEGATADGAAARDRPDPAPAAPPPPGPTRPQPDRDAGAEGGGPTAPAPSPLGNAAGADRSPSPAPGSTPARASSPAAAASDRESPPVPSAGASESVVTSPAAAPETDDGAPPGFGTDTAAESCEFRELARAGDAPEERGIPSRSPERPAPTPAGAGVGTGAGEEAPRETSQPADADSDVTLPRRGADETDQRGGGTCEGAGASPREPDERWRSRDGAAEPLREAAAAPSPAGTPSLPQSPPALALPTPPPCEAAAGGEETVAPSPRAVAAAPSADENPASWRDPRGVEERSASTAETGRPSPPPPASPPPSGGTADATAPTPPLPTPPEPPEASAACEADDAEEAPDAAAPPDEAPAFPCNGERPEPVNGCSPSPSDTRSLSEDEDEDGGRAPGSPAPADGAGGGDADGEAGEVHDARYGPRTFNLGDLVWGQIKGFPSWPGKLVRHDEVRSAHPTRSEDGKVWVMWFGDHSFTQVEPEKLKTLSEGLEAHHRARKRYRKSRKLNSSLEAAIQEAMTELDKMTEAADEQPKGRSDKTPKGAKRRKISR
ncbi:methyl-CpG-binding domain protein 5-like [Lethenteron reissneri]|uniref:methyl-CpG-binding domain protein 5-like n=1 Tax=Lethenteron reissneri TaxID=7753 RepID=UPI002AB6A7D0|nr:methyl-CpG-binding domain protein 5-like [Lethenteron reissneri]